MNDPGGGSIGGTSLTSSPSRSGISVVGWILAASTVAILYQYKWARPYVTGVVVITLLGMVLKSESTVTAQIKSIVKG